MSRYHSPYASRQKTPRPWPMIILVVLALLIGTGIGVVAGGGSMPFGLGKDDPEPTQIAVVNVPSASDEEPTDEPEDEPSATAEEVDEPTEEAAASTVAIEPTHPPSTATTTLEPTQTLAPQPTATNDAGPPEAFAQNFADIWTAGDYGALYELLSGNAKSVITKDDFVTRFEAIGTEVGIIETRVKLGGDPDLELRVPLEITYATGTVGEFTQQPSLQIVREGADWRAEWSASMIFTQLGDGCVEFMLETVRRGSILDRNGEPLAYDGSASVIGVVPGNFVNEDAEVKALSDLVDMSESDIRETYAEAEPGWFVSIKQFPNEVDDATKTAISNLPGVSLRSQTARIYPLGKRAAHITGYVTKVSAEDIENDPSGELAGVEWIGRAGIEAGADDLLTGQPGGRLMVVDCESRAERAEIAERRPEQPRDVILTIDKDFQMEVDRAVGDITGSAVVIDPRTGAVLALVSHPAYDPNWFVSGMTGKDREFINDAKKRPLLDRAAEAAYPTGSIFKVITMAAAMHDLDYTGETQIDCPQEFSLPGTDQVWRDWTYEEGLGPQGMLNLHTGLVNSCNTVFYQLGAALDEGDENWLPDMTKAFGLGAPTGIPYFPEVSGTVPSPDWKLEVVGDYWARGDAVNMAIGQGFLEATPLQMANAYAAIANGGTLLQPFIVEFQLEPDGSQKRIGKRTELAELPLGEDEIAEIQWALRDHASNSWGAGAVRLFGDFGWPIASKTGTAQNQMTVEQLPHSWFAAFGPYGEEATIASIVMVESSGEGITFAGPRTKTIYEAYLETDLMSED